MIILIFDIFKYYIDKPKEEKKTCEHLILFLFDTHYLEYEKCYVCITLFIKTKKIIENKNGQLNHYEIGQLFISTMN
jgi:hypothetical protein